MFHQTSKEQSDDHQYESLELNISKLIVTNVRTEPTSRRTKLEEHLETLKTTNFFQQTQWPFSTKPTKQLSPFFEKRPYDTYLYTNPLSAKTNVLAEPPSNSTALHTYYTMTTDSLKKVGGIFSFFLAHY